MRVFLLDLWLDLRAKRLAPLAILLLAAIIAVPILIAKGTSNNTPTVPTATTAKAPAAPVIQSEVQAGTVESKLQTFSPRDPFEPTGHVAAATTGSSTTSSSGGSSSSTKTTTTTGTTGATGTTGGGGGTTGSGPIPTGNGNGTGTGTTGTGNTTGQTKTELFTYTVDVRFGEAGNVLAYKDVKRLDLLPSAKNPKIVFLGVTTTGKTAVFLVDSNIGVDTPGGKCRPSNDNCTFLYLRPDTDHSQATLTDSDGTVYHLRLVAIHRVSISSANGGGTTNSGSGNSGTNGSGKNRSKAFTGNADSSSTDSNSVPGGDSAPPGEPNNQSDFQQFFADGSGPGN